jgi:hypothetical protein
MKGKIFEHAKVVSIMKAANNANLFTNSYA